MVCFGEADAGERSFCLLIRDRMRVSCTKKALPARTAVAERVGYTETQITFCSIHLPRTKRTQKNSERMAQSRNMPIQMNSRPQWNLSTIR